ncbi:MAG: phosphatase PAP2 family protein [Pseudonocardiaceae bacterium]
MGYLNSALSWRDDLPDLPPPHLLLAAGLVLLAALALVARWGIGHPDRMLAPVHRLRTRSAVARLEHRYARQLRFLAERMRPKSSAALILMAALGAVALLVGTLTEITEDVVTGDELVRVDSPVFNYFVENREPWLTTTMGLITHLGSTVVLVPMLLAVGLVARRRRHTWAPMVFLAVTLGGATLTSTVIKVVIARSRPPSEALVDALGYAFPSGHSTAAAAGWLAAAAVLAWLTRSLTVQINLIAAALGIAVLVGISRIYLGVHAPTDVLAGWALGALWLAATLTVTHLLILGKR